MSTDKPITATSPPEPTSPKRDRRPRYIIVSPWNLLLKVTVGVLAFALLISLLVNVFILRSHAQYFQDDDGITEHHHSGNKNASDKIAVIDISGVILDGDGFVKKQIDRIREDEDIKAVVLRVNSPGGAVSGADYMYHHLKELRDERNLKVVVSMGSIAASGGYYVSMAVGDQERSIYAEPTTITGSIGVIIPRYDVSEAMDKYDIASDSIYRGEFKEMGSWTKSMPPEHRAKMQALVDEMFEGFKQVIKEGRPNFREDPDALDQLATGEIFTANQAKKFGLIDEIGFLEDAVERAAKLAALGKDKYRVIEYHKPAGLIDQLAIAQASQHNSPADAILELATPRAYYIYTWLPPLIKGEHLHAR